MSRESCERCGRYFDYNTSIPQEDADLCPICRERRYVLPYHRWQPRYDFLSVEGEDTNLYYGIEIEVGRGGESDGNAAFLIDSVGKDNDKWFVYVSHDSSIVEGFEVITTPMTYEYHKSKKGLYERMFSILKEMNYSASCESSCGLHVHFSRDFFVDDNDNTSERNNIIKFMKLFNKFYDDILMFGRRDKNIARRYAKRLPEDISDFYSRYNQMGNNSHEAHYFCVNIANYKTIELRVFQSTMNADMIMYILTLCDILVHKAKELSFEEIMSSRLTFASILKEDKTGELRKYYDTRKAMSAYEDKQ